MNNPIVTKVTSEVVDQGEAIQAEEPLARRRVHVNPNYAVWQNADGTLDFVKHAKR